MATTLALLLALFLLPLPLLGEEPLAEPSRSPAATGTLLIDHTVVTPGQTADGRVQVRVALEDGEVLTLPLDKYLWRVVAARMPASFEPEVLKTQTVAAHTYTLSKMECAVEAHPDADVHTDITCYQTYINPADAAANWGENAQTYTDRIAVAVMDTDDVAILFQGQSVQAVFFSSAARRTMGAVKVWGNVVLYLTDMDSPEGDEVPNYHSTVTVLLGESKSKLPVQHPQTDLFGKPAGQLANFVPSSVGGVETVDIDDTTVGGGSLHTLFGLRSTNFTVSVSADEVTFFVTSYGHGMDMSQYGTSALAKEGKSYDEILKWYYTGIDVTPYTPQR